MTIRLSIIIPCYNCADTLREAVDSCYEQNLNENDFEIVMVNDGSSDNTMAVMLELSKEYPNIKIIDHKTNYGGGAARNTGIKASKGEIIYCLDSDNVFAQDSVGPILSFLEQEQLDGAAYHERRFFLGPNKKSYTSHFNNKLAENIGIEDIFSIEKNILLDNFFFTRNAYDKTLGYPQNHGFDTQCFELRFLSIGAKVRVCPESIFYHRQDVKQDSYFQRVYKSGLFSRNYYLITEDIIHLLSQSTREILMTFPIFDQTKLNRSNLKAILDIHLKENPNDFFVADYKSYLRPEGREEAVSTLKESSHPADIFALAVMQYNNGDSQKSQETYNRLLVAGTDSSVIYFNLLRLAVSSTNKYEPRQVEDKVAEVCTSLTPKTQKLNSMHLLLGRIKKMVKY